MDTITILGIAALAGIFAAWTTEPKKKRQRVKPSPAPTTPESPPLLTADETIFISHHATNQDGVETLARNLNNMGYLVFWDIWKTATKQTVDFEGQNLRQNHTILVVTPETIESGWVREEYELMLKRQQHDPDFTFIPVAFNDVLSDSPFLSASLINFSAEKYQEAFHQLVSHLSHKPFDEKDLELPSPAVAPTVPVTSDTREFIKTRLTHFEQNSPPPLILLAQNDRNQAPMVEALLTEAKTRYQAEHCLHIALSYNLETDMPNYFALLAQQSGLSETVNNGIEFEQALLARLNNHSTPLFLLISRFEHGAQSTRQQVAGMVRSLNESHANQLHIILCGGEKLAELKYPHHSPSVLNTAEVYQWPELTRAEVYAMRNNFDIELALDEDSADKLLVLSGRHPVLLQKCLQLFQSEPTLEWQDYPAALSHDPFVWRLFTPFRQKEAEQVREWLAQEKVAPSSALFSYDHQRNALLRRLYWNNMLVEQPVEGRKHLCWRCEALRLAGKEIYSF
ncbi:MAG TPA: toll/interleukin-1 receptor domain-containing protein [Thiotrichaceae bacterium]|nr:toll/interleukin-1 receptor domain-containing protein [Thiotrichaceae bacterium]